MFMPYISVLDRTVPYHQDLPRVFHSLCENQPYSLMLESAEIASKNSVQSLLLVNGSVKISCLGQTVQFQALTANGKAVLFHIQQKLQSIAKCTQGDDNNLTAVFAPLDQNLDEDSKLQSATIFDGLRVIQQIYAQSTIPVFLGGLFAYDLVANFIPMDNIQLNDDGLNCPDYVFYLAENLLRFDHQNQTAHLQTFCFAHQYQENLSQSAENIAQALESLKPLPELVKTAKNDTALSVNLNDDVFKGIIENLKAHIYQGDVFQIVPSRRFSLPCPNPLHTYAQLKSNNPSPYMFYLQDKDFILFGASPESALKYTADNRQLQIYPIAGSRPRGFDKNGNIDPELDARLELELRLDAKEQAEHLMLVDLARNDVARVCQSGTRFVKELMQVDRYSHIMHLVSRVVGKLRPELDALHAYQACMNMGTLTGAPKIKAMQLIYQYEKQKRHSYGGAVGYLSSDGNLDTCIVIRSAFVQNGVAYVQAGCGEVLDSDPQMEADETRHKARAVLNAIQQTHYL